MTKQFCDRCKEPSDECEQWLIGKFIHYKADEAWIQDSLVYSKKDIISDICFDCQCKIDQFVRGVSNES